MMNKDDITIVVQGKLFPETPYVISLWADAGFSAIYSGWTNEPLPMAHPRVLSCYSDDVKPGVGNRNRQIQSSARGLHEVKTKYAWKVRSDQIYPVESINKCYDFFLNHDYRDKKIFTPGLYSKEVFHIRDHQTLGKTNELKKLWGCAFDKYDGPADYNVCLRAETYLVVNYLDFYSTTVMSMRMKYKDFLLDNSPKRDEALAKSEVIMSKFFVPFQKVEFSWPKHGMASYHYDYCEQVHGEWWSK